MKAKEKKIALIVAAVLGFLFLETALFFYADRPLAEYTQSLNVSHLQLIDFFRGITDWGKGVWYLVPCGLATVFCGFLSRGKDVPPPYRRLFAYIGVRAFFLFATVGISGILVDILKVVVGRARPHLWLSDGVYGFHAFTGEGFLWNSMPSGHSTTVFAVAFALSFLYPRLRALWLAYALLLGASRIMVDAHYLSDVCAGAALGWLTVWAFVRYGMIHVWKVIFPIDTALLKK